MSGVRGIDIVTTMKLWNGSNQTVMETEHVIVQRMVVRVRLLKVFLGVDKAT